MFKKLSVKIALAFSILFALFVVSPKTYATFSFESGASTFPIYRKVVLPYPSVSASNTISNTFRYTITPSASNPANGATNEPATATIEFASVTPTALPAPSTVRQATATGVVDFCPQGGTCTTYSKTGIYEYTIAETASVDTSVTPPTDNSALYPLDNKTYTIKVQVVRDTDSNNVPTDDLVATVISDGFTDDGNGQEVKESAEWESYVKIVHIGMATTTHGNYAGLSECFDYTITIQTGTNVAAGTQYQLSTVVVDSNQNQTPSSCSPQSGNGTNGVYTLTAGQSTTFSMAHGDVMWATVPISAVYTITAVTDQTDDLLVTTLDGNTSPLSVTKTAADVDYSGIGQQYAAGNPTQNATFVDRTREAPVLSGIFTNIWFYIALLAIVAVGIFIAIKRSKTRAELYAKTK